MEDPRRGDITHLEPYDYIIGTGMDVHLRSVLVGTAHILYIIHGGFGSAIEFNSQIDQKGIAAFWNIEASRYGMVKAAPELLKQTYKDTDAVFFRNTDYKHLIERSFIEWLAITKGLGDKLSAILLYEHTHLPEDHSERQRTDCALINFRECGKPVTYYHRGKRHKPIRQLIFTGLTPEQLLEFYKSQNPELAKEMKPEERRLRYERGIMFSLPLEKLNDGSAMQAMQKTIEKIQQEKGERVLFYDYRF